MIIFKKKYFDALDKNSSEETSAKNNYYEIAASQRVGTREIFNNAH